MSTTFKLPTVTVAAPQAPTPVERDRVLRHAKALSWLSLAWMTVEGTVAITAALIAGSVALLGFGIDSAIEGLALTVGDSLTFTGAAVRRRAHAHRRDLDRPITGRNPSRATWPARPSWSWR